MNHAFIDHVQYRIQVRLSSSHKTYLICLLFPMPYINKKNYVHNFTQCLMLDITISIKQRLGMYENTSKQIQEKGRNSMAENTKPNFSICTLHQVLLKSVMRRKGGVARIEKCKMCTELQSEIVSGKDHLETSVQTDSIQTVCECTEQALCTYQQDNQPPDEKRGRQLICPRN